jgi:integrase
MPLGNARISRGLQMILRRVVSIRLQYRVKRSISGSLFRPLASVGAGSISASLSSSAIFMREAAEKVRREVEARLTLGDLTFLSDGGKPVPTFSDYATGWLETYAEVECKPSTRRSCAQLFRLHVTPRFGQKKLTDICRDEIKQFLSETCQATKQVGEVLAPKYAKNTLRLIACALRTVLNAAVEDGLIESNPAARIGRLAKSEEAGAPGGCNVSAGKRKLSDRSHRDLSRMVSVLFDCSPGWAALRKGELIALKWGEIQFGESAADPNRYILVQRNYSHGCFTSPKSNRSRRVDLSRQLRSTLLEPASVEAIESNWLPPGIRT